MTRPLENLESALSDVDGEFIARRKPCTLAESGFLRTPNWVLRCFIWFPGSLSLSIPGGLPYEEFSWQPFQDELPSDLDVTPTVGGCVNSNVHSQQEAPP